jgi:hypothetical protein
MQVDVVTGIQICALHHESMQSSEYSMYFSSELTMLDGGYKYPFEGCCSVYSLPSSVFRHFKSTHLGIKYMCPECNKQFTRP